ncbi:hypothetical protein RQP54_00040 [Curvibacter sp. APW13]|uniref:hypothetical protein n=1 Tax=Curvibacter sp. APW13 TaxID=3077236 RepID=UPI0028E043AC|nr:hypothetical protein [Curvibacter sp. APW13]MDT8989244.1 hypothetical protein [Curvibacter sp. APW13]
MSRLLHALLRPLISIAVIVLLLEEWLWDHLKAAVQRLVDQPWVHRLEAYLRALPPWASLLVLVAPGVVIIPFKVAGLWALAQGHALLGVVIFVLAKLAGTAVAAYLFDLVRDSARRMPWFDRVYVWIERLLQRAHAWLESRPVVRQVRAWAQALRQRVRGWLRH